jgi:sugar fermentation stimulation protein A
MGAGRAVPSGAGRGPDRAAVSAPLLRFPELTAGNLIRRYKRFLADIRLEDGSAVTAHVPNSGRMTSVDMPGSEVLLSKHDSSGRKLAWTLELLRVSPGPYGWAGVNTNLPNALVSEAVRAHLIPELEGYESLQREVVCAPGTRLDLRLESANRPACWVEIKNVTLVENGDAYFPDAVTDRGRKHLEVLAALAEKGERAVIFYLVQRPDCNILRPADHVDPRYGETLRRVLEKGVEALAYRSRLGRDGADIDERVRFNVS